MKIYTKFCKNCPNVPAIANTTTNPITAPSGINQESAPSTANMPRGDPIVQKKLTAKTITVALTPEEPSFLQKKEEISIKSVYNVGSILVGKFLGLRT